MDNDFLPDTGFGYPTPKIRPDADLARSDFCWNCTTVGLEMKSQWQHITSISLSVNVEHNPAVQVKRGIITVVMVDGLQWPAKYCYSLLDSPLPRQLPQVSRVSYFHLNAWSTVCVRRLSFTLVLTVGTTATMIEQMNALSRHSCQGFHT